MKKIHLISIILALVFAHVMYACDTITTYGTQIARSARYNINGVRLNSIKSVLKQERANFYRYHGNNKYAQKDTYFSKKSNRELFTSALLSISPSLEKKILGKDPIFITVTLFKPNLIKVEDGLSKPEKIKVLRHCSHQNTN